MAGKAKAEEKEQKRLPEMEDPAIEEIEEAARAYNKVKNQRVGLTRKEVDLKGVLLQTMEALQKDGLSPQRANR